MAKGQAGFNSTTVGLIAFAALWLTSTVLLIYLYTGQAALDVENQRLAAAKAKLINSQQEKSVELVKSASESGPTVVGLLEDARGATAALATGEATDSAATVRNKRDQALSIIKSEGIVPKADGLDNIAFHEALTRVYEALKAEHQLRKTAEDTTARLQGEVGALVEANATLKADFEKRAKESSDRLAQAEGDRSTYRVERDKQVEKMEKDFEESRRRNDAELTRERQVRQAAEQQLADLQKRFAAQQEKLGGLLIGPEKLSTARTPDGRVLTAIPGDEVVYVNLGRKNGLTLGLQFAVYSKQTGIPEDGRAKAQIEVVSISEASAECKIVRVNPTDVILEGDLIANPVYDPDRPLTFVVAGDFDLNRDGAVDTDGTRDIEALITNWGAKVATDLTALTDFVVLGVPPKRPRATGEAASAAAPGSQLAAPTAGAPRNAWERYNSIAETAKTLAVPTMTQDVFLNFLGYSGRGTGR